MDFFRYNGLGNDYLVIDPSKTSIKMNKNSIRSICNRHFGEGSDGILYGPLIDDNGRIILKIFNPDGSEAEKSGNGTRIFARYLVDAGYKNEAIPFEFTTAGGVVKAYVIDKKNKIKMAMGRAIFECTKIPIISNKKYMLKEPLKVNGQTLFISCVSMGNPHCVILTDDISKEKANDWGPQIENNPIFPNRTNVQLLKIIDKHNIQIEIWERGAGYTLASGTSSCAATAVATRLGLVSKGVTVHMPGGQLFINVEDNFDIEMTGPVSFVSKGTFSSEIIETLS